MVLCFTTCWVQSCEESGTCVTKARGSKSTGQVLATDKHATGLEATVRAQMTEQDFLKLAGSSFLPEPGLKYASVPDAWKAMGKFKDVRYISGPPLLPETARIGAIPSTECRAGTQ